MTTEDLIPKPPEFQIHNCRGKRIFESSPYPKPPRSPFSLTQPPYIIELGLPILSNPSNLFNKICKSFCEFDIDFKMKFLEYTPLERLNDFFSDLNLGERTIKGCLEAYSCKHTGSDKKLSLSLENEILDYLGKSSDSDSSSPADSLLSRSSRKTLIYLVLTLYHLYPDYDVSAVNAHQFFAEDSWDSFKQIFDTYLVEASKEWAETNEGGSLLDTLYKALDEVVGLADSEVYGYSPDADADPFLERGAVWSFNFFFYNRKLKRVVSFRFSCLSNLVSDGFMMDELNYEEDGEIFDVMDM